MGSLWDRASTLEDRHRRQVCELEKLSARDALGQGAAPGFEKNWIPDPWNGSPSTVTMPNSTFAAARRATSARRLRKIPLQ